MMRTAIRRKFAGPSSFFRKMIDLPKRMLNLTLEPQENNSTYGNQTAEAFDAVSQEWQSAIVGNAYDLQSMAYYDAVAQMNFGTVDNPHVIYTADTPFRYVICTGQPNEDDYEGHEALVFMLREGPLQRCVQCGQVYKLVRLRNEVSAEMDYYRSGLLPLGYGEMGEADHWSQNSIIRMMPTSFEHTQFEVESHSAYSLVNPDEHDRILTDPAYRLEKIAKAKETAGAMIAAMRVVDQEFRDTNPATFVIPMNKIDYQVMLDIETAMRKTDRIYASLRKFHARQFLDPSNHERREKRMEERKRERQIESYTVFFGSLSEQEQQVKDYFETEEKDKTDESTQEFLDSEVVRGLAEYRTEKFDFQELYSRQPVEDASSIEERLVFRFVNRRAIDTVSDYERKQKRMEERSVQRMKARNVGAAHPGRTQQSRPDSLPGWRRSPVRCRRPVLRHHPRRSSPAVRRLLRVGRRRAAESAEERVRRDQGCPAGRVQRLHQNRAQR